MRELNLAQIDPVGIDESMALEILKAPVPEFMAFLPLTNALREKYHGNRVKLCSIVNAKSGHCPEVCNFCPQSAHFRDAKVEAYPLMEPDTMLAVAMDSEANGSSEFSIVTSGRGMTSEKELAKVEAALLAIGEKSSLDRCASLGMVDRLVLERLQAAGLTNYHHNLETAKSFFPNIVSTHTWEDEVASVKLAKEMGLTVCSGGIFGMGESLEQRIEFIFQVKELKTDKFPINFLNPRPGTPLANTHDLTPIDCLKIVAVARLAMPDRDIFVLGGREVNLRNLQSMIFMAGANGTMVGNYLTTSGQKSRDTVQMIQDLGLTLVGEFNELLGTGT